VWAIHASTTYGGHYPYPSTLIRHHHHSRLPHRFPHRMLLQSQSTNVRIALRSPGASGAETTRLELNYAMCLWCLRTSARKGQAVVPEEGLGEAQSFAGEREMLVKSVLKRIWFRSCIRFEHARMISTCIGRFICTIVLCFISGFLFLCFYLPVYLPALTCV